MKQEELDTWLRLEFQHNFEQLRNRDEKILDLFKFYITGVAAIIGACISFLNLKELENKHLVIGLFLILSCLLGELLFIWLVAFRKYFVITARQLNAIRNYYSNEIESKIKADLIIQPTDKNYPDFFRVNSAHTIIIIGVTIINLIIGIVGLFLILRLYYTFSLCVVLIIIILFGLWILILNYFYVKINSKF